MSNKIKRLIGRHKRQSTVKKWPKEFKVGEGERPLLATMTGEPFQLARIHYDLLDKNKIKSIFAELKCMEFDSGKNRWVWNYQDEAKKLKFKSSYDEIPKEYRPIIIGSFYLPNEQHMYLDVNSFDRAMAAIQFFDKYLGRKIVSLSHMQILNKLLEAVPGIIPNHDDFFDCSSPEKPDHKSNLDIIAADNKLTRSEKIALAQQDMDANLKKSIKEIESLPIHFYEDGINGLAQALQIRSIIAFEHWRGNLTFTYFDIFKKMFPPVLGNAPTNGST